MMSMVVAAALSVLPTVVVVVVVVAVGRLAVNTGIARMTGMVHVRYSWI